LHLKVLQGNTLHIHTITNEQLEIVPVRNNGIGTDVALAGQMLGKK
jgi:hypothetical protein